MFTYSFIYLSFTHIFTHMFFHICILKCNNYSPTDLLLHSLSGTTRTPEKPESHPNTTICIILLSLPTNSVCSLTISLILNCPMASTSQFICLFTVDVVWYWMRRPRMHDIPPSKETSFESGIPYIFWFIIGISLCESVQSSFSLPFQKFFAIDHPILFR